jgi:hypothetical protein
MKKAIVLMFLLGAVILNGTWMMQGCTGRIPSLSAIVATSTPTLGPNIVANFEGGDDTINTNLVNSSNPNFNWLPGTIVSAVGAPGANGTAFAGNVYVAATALSGYTPYELEANPNSSGTYDLSSTAYGSATNGIQFYWKTGPTDNMPARWFIAPVPQQIPPPVGNCAGSCYDTFKKPLAGTGNSWILVQLAWGTFTQAGWGSPSTGGLASNSLVNGQPNLSQILYFQWEEDPNALPGTYGCDFWVDEVQLY